MTDKTEGLEVVAWQHVFADGRIVSYSEEQAGFPARDDALKVEPLVTLASAQAEGLAYEAHYEGALDHITALESALAQMTVQRDLMQQEIYTLNRLLKIAHDGPRIAALDAALRQARDALDVATNSLGSFTMDHGCSQVDFDNTDTALAALCTLNQILK